MTQSIFCPPYDNWSDEALLDHFRKRTNVVYFALRDHEQACPDKMAGVLENRFDFNGEAHQLPAHFDWTSNPSVDREWLILLHKFYFAAGLGEDFCTTGDLRYLEKWVELTAAWIDTVALDFLPPDVCGRRVQNWIFAHYYFVTQAKHQAKHASIPLPFYRKFLNSLYQQVNFLCANLTPARNHRTIELYAIFMAAVIFPEFSDAARWLEFSCQELLANIESDILPDGVHCEMSTDYHHLVLRNYLNIAMLARLNQIAMPAGIEKRIKAALEFAKYVHKPDGVIPALSDGDSRPFQDVLRQGFHLFQDQELAYVATQGKLGRMPKERSKLFAESGYAILRSGWGGNGDSFAEERYLVFDCGPLGAGNHGHLDLLSFEMAAYGRSLVVDPGRYTYHEPPIDSGETNWRVYFRSTSAHNTVQIDNREQTRYVFHKNRFKIKGAEPHYALKHFSTSEEHDCVHGVVHSHEYPVVHERIIDFVRGKYWVVTDLLHASELHDYDLRFHLSQNAYGKTAIEIIDDQVVIRAPHLLLIQPFDPKTTVSIEDGYVSQQYGIKHAAPIVRFHRSAANWIFQTILYPSKSAAPSYAACRPHLSELSSLRHTTQTTL